MNEIEKDQIVGLSEQESDDILGPISLDKNNQMIEVNRTGFVGDFFI